MDLQAFLAPLPRGDLWIFGYGSLMWAPEFRPAERSFGRLHGYHRALCILSMRYRGTLKRPGLVMGLCRGGSCWGVALRVRGPHVRATLEHLWRREMPRRVYMPRLLAVRIRGGRLVRALAFVANPEHPHFVHELALPELARLVAQGVGERGHCVEYIANTIAHMGEIGVQDPHLERVLEAAQALRMRRSASSSRAR
jgi:cation transport protein ChaC